MYHFAAFKLSVIAVLLSTTMSAHSNELSLDETLSYAFEHEPWLTASKYQQTAVEAQSLAAGTLPDPVLTIGLLNLPTDGFALSQEGMTQFKLGISQMFSRGNSLALKQHALAQSAQQYPWLRADRLAQIKTIIIEAWLNAYRAQRSIALIEQDKALFSQLINVTEANYASSLGNTRQQDIIRAQLELTQLEDKLLLLTQQLESAKKRLSQWLPMSLLMQPLSSQYNKVTPLVDFTSLQSESLMTLLLAHPAIIAIDKNVSAKQTEVEVAKQSYKPQWGVEVGYGYRADTPMGESRADMFSIGMSIDLPLFTDHRQDQQVNAALARAEALKTEKLIALQKLKGLYFKEVSQLALLQKRDTLYQTKLLPQMAVQAQATLNAYTRDDGDFSAVMRARISELNANIDALNIKIDQQIITARLNYYASSLDAAINVELTRKMQYEN